MPAYARSGLYQALVGVNNTKEYASRINCVMHHASSQFHEDLTLLPTLLKVANGRPGTFVELGALDGLRWSNTRVLEACYDWKGLLIEANPRNFELLQRSGRRAKKIHSAICADGVGFAEVTVDGDAVAGEVGVMTAAHVRKWTTRGLLTNRTTPVPCTSLSHIMASAGVSRVDFLSLDVEGAEEEVLKHADLNAFELVLMEWKAEQKGGRYREAEHLLLSAGLCPWTSSRRGCARGLGTPPQVPFSRIYVAPTSLTRIQCEQATHRAIANTSSFTNNASKCARS